MKAADLIFLIKESKKDGYIASMINLKKV